MSNPNTAKSVWSTAVLEDKQNDQENAIPDTFYKKSDGEKISYYALSIDVNYKAINIYIIILVVYTSMTKNRRIVLVKV